MRTVGLICLAYVALATYALIAALTVIGWAILAIAIDVIDLVRYCWTTWPYRLPVRVIAYGWLAWSILTAG